MLRHVKGTVLLASDHTPCTDALVAVYRWRPGDQLRRESWAYAWRRPPLAMVQTDENGQYAFENLRPGLHQLRVVFRDHLQTHTRDNPVEIRAGEETIRNLAVASGAKLAGRVTDRETGKPIAGAEVFFPAYRTKQAITDGDGRYELVF